MTTSHHAQIQTSSPREPIILRWRDLREIHATTLIKCIGNVKLLCTIAGVNWPSAVTAGEEYFQQTDPDVQTTRIKKPHDDAGIAIFLLENEVVSAGILKSGDKFTAKAIGHEKHKKARKVEMNQSSRQEAAP
jgi:hypothetical protein